MMGVINQNYKIIYMQSTISSIGPKESPLYYDGLSSTIIDYVKRMTPDNETKRG